MRELRDYYVLTSLCTEEDAVYVRSGLKEYNRLTSPSSQPSEPVNIIVKNNDGDVLGGILAGVYRFVMYVEILWIHENHRKSGIGRKLLVEIERKAKEKGCSLIHLDTFNFQAPDFYINNGFEIFGVLEGYPEGEKRFFLKKDI